MPTLHRLALLLLLLCLTLPLSCTAALPAPGPTVQWICSTETKPWQNMPAVPLTVDPSAWPVVKIYPKRTLQTLDGFGGCFNELGEIALQKLPAAERDKALKALFDDSGCAFNMARMPIGASDFGKDWYSLDDTEDDLALAHFSIDRDKKCLIPYIKSALAYRKDLKVWGSAWSPPVWMKTTNTYNGGSLSWKPDNLKAYANYLAMYAEAYRKEGINIYAVHVQNEPNINSIYPSCIWSPAHIRDFVRDYMGPTFKERKLDAEIWLGTICENNFCAVPDTVLSDPKANAFITGVALQYYGRDQLTDIATIFPDKKMIQSETECHNGLNSWSDAENTFSLISLYFNRGVSAYFMWNMVLDETGKSSWNWSQNAMITADTTTGKAMFNPEFYAMQHYSHFIKPGAKRLYVAGPWKDKLAFQNPDGTIVLVLGNSASDDYIFSIALADDPRTVTFQLPAHSFNTYILPKP